LKNVKEFRDTIVRTVLPMKCLSVPGKKLNIVSISVVKLSYRYWHL